MTDLERAAQVWRSGESTPDVTDPQPPCKRAGHPASAVPEGRDADGAGWKWLRVVLKNHLPDVEFKLWEQLDAEQRQSAARLQAELAHTLDANRSAIKYADEQHDRAEAAERTVQSIMAIVQRIESLPLAKSSHAESAHLGQLQMCDEIRAALAPRET